MYDWSYSAFKGNQAIYFYLQPDKDINVLETIDLIKASLVELNEGPLSSLDLKVVMSRDNSLPIKQALLLVYGNLLVGVLLACSFLYYFIRNLRVVFLIFVSIPVCLSLVLLGMQLGGRSLNLISLAGMALFVGLLLDASIIIVDNIQRLRSTGLSLLESCRQGVLQVRAALISSTFKYRHFCTYCINALRSKPIIWVSCIYYFKCFGGFNFSCAIFITSIIATVIIRSDRCD